MSRALRHRVESGLYLRELDALEGGDARPVLWIHGLGESGLCFESLVTRPELARFRHLILDLPGYGRSPAAVAPIGLPAAADLLADVVLRLGWNDFLVGGHSMGGVIGILLAERHPSRVRGFLNIEGNVSRGDCVFSSQAAGIPVARFVGARFDEIRERIYEDGLSDPALRGYYASLRFADAVQFHHNAAELVQLSQSESLAERHARLSCATRYVAGVPRGVTERSHELLAAAGARVESIDRCGHWPFIDRPDAFARVAAAFLAEAA